MDNKNNTATKQPTMQELQDRIKQLEQDLAAKNNRTIYWRVAEETGSISVYGVQNQRPVSLYSQQWVRLIEALTGKPMADDAPLTTFLKTNEKYIALKDDTEEQSKTKHTLRLAESHGVVNHPKNKQAA